MSTNYTLGEQSVLDGYHRETCWVLRHGVALEDVVAGKYVFILPYHTARPAASLLPPIPVERWSRCMQKSCAGWKERASRLVGDRWKPSYKTLERVGKSNRKEMKGRCAVSVNLRQDTGRHAQQKGLGTDGNSG